MTLWQRIKQGMQNAMAGRHGTDKLSQHMIYAGLALYIVDLFVGSGVFLTVGLALYVYSFFRIMSRNNDKRNEENRKYTARLNNINTKVSQSRNRFKNRKVYKYFKCGNCHAWLRVKKGSGEVTGRCGRCQQTFKQKA